MLDPRLLSKEARADLRHSAVPLPSDPTGLYKALRNIQRLLDHIAALEERLADLERPALPDKCAFCGAEGCSNCRIDLATKRIRELEERLERVVGELEDGGSRYEDGWGRIGRALRIAKGEE